MTQTPPVAVPVPLPKKITWIVLTLTVLLVVFNLIGVAASFFFDILPARGVSTLLFAVIWLVLGAFTGALHYNSAGYFCSTVDDPLGWADAEGAWEIGRLVMRVTIAELLLLCAAFYLLWWRHGIDFDVFVPDNCVLTLIHFAAIVGTMAFVRSALHDRPKAPGDV